MEFAPLQLLPMVVVAVMYWLRNHRVHTPAWRQWCFYGGLALMAVTLSSPLATMSEELFWAHMLEHLLIADLGALLIVLGLTGPVLAPLLRAIPWLRAFGHPVVALVAWTANFYVWHLPALYQGAVSNDTVHALQHMLFVSFGIAMWMALLGPLPKPGWFGNGWKIGYIVAIRLIQSVLANALFWSSGVLYPQYARGQAEWGISAANDQSAAGAIMMIEGSVITILLFGWLFLKAARESEERQELAELADRLGVEMAPERIARAVAAGRGAALRERITSSARQG
ncbi:cytochrome c oxidase assembly protein [Solirubrobacter sp. CPCC 204708]|uniref:Cytochrome c oxidase assembly protein n=1 Tax=Solirubrobacter deserti TaxID=2282478 RepID=A0ABT4RSV0_9ACTN|nr:cytochrome c oxidase assembly protein [Solirubrobacter deserti]MBE2316441.1 cytochrome c oxidase assembly protein [Solirubrobacter deserti]MDA0141644.1 cytochrome c oxidase assembly protein [Solirubrobacter deserti]